MANTRQLVGRRRAIRNIRKITRTMELIATSRFKRRSTVPPRPRPTRARSPSWPPT